MFNEKISRASKKEALKILVNLGFNPKVIIDGGYGMGTEGLFDNFPQSKKIVIEPLDDFKEIIQLHSKKYHNFFYEKCLLSDKIGKRELQKRPGLTTSSVYFDKTSPESVNFYESTTIDQLFQKYSIKEEVLLKLDLEGHELDALNGAKKSLDKIELVICEMSLWRSKKNIPSLFDIFSFFEKNNFYLIDIVEIGYTESTKMARQFDGFFLNKNSNISKIKILKTKIQREKSIKHKQSKFLKELENARKFK